MALVDKNCRPVQKGSAKISFEEIDELSAQTPDWEVHEKHIERTFDFDDFSQAMEFAQKIADIANAEDHHPDLHISYGKVRVELTTHSAGGLSENDFIMAAKIDHID